MSRPVLHHDAQRCIGCHACEVQCLTHHARSTGPAACQVVSVAASEPSRLRHTFVRCEHCDEAPCIAACPSGAMKRRERDGLVLVEQSQCIGCLTCIAACPTGAPRWDPSSRQLVKCDGCADRLDAGHLPACVAACVTGCLTLAEPARSSAERVGA